MSQEVSDDSLCMVNRQENADLMSRSTNEHVECCGKSADIENDSKCCSSPTGKTDSRDVSSSSDEESTGRKDSTPRVPNNTPNTSPPSSTIQTTTPSQLDTPQPSSPKPSSLSQTTLCRHWCHHGNCKWGSQCRYKHIMPLSLAGLIEVGLRDWPSWYRAFNPGYFVDSSIGFTQHNPHRARLGRRVISAGAGGVGRRGAVDVELGEEIIERLRRMERERAVEKERSVRESEVEEDEKRKEARKRIAEERRAREEGSVRGMAVQREVEKGARRWADDDSEDEVVPAVKTSALGVVDNKTEANLVEL
jgi:hypothetical protein